MFLTKFGLRRSIAFQKVYTSFLAQSVPQCTNAGMISMSFRQFSTNPDKKSEADKEATSKPEGKVDEKENQQKAESTTSDDSDEEVTLKAKEIKSLLKEQDDEIEMLRKKLENARQQYQYQLAENDNTVKRYKDEIEKTKEFAISKFAKDLLEVRDNLQLAVNHAQKTKIETVDDLEKVKLDFENLFNGLKMTSTVFDNTMKRFKVEEYNPEGEAFNPNYHEAMFVVEDQTKEPNTICVVLQSGWKIGDRVLRASKVGCVKRK